MPRTRRAASEAASSESVLPERRILREEQAIPRSISTEEIREYFECPVCYNVPRPGAPIYACAQGHMICSECRPLVTQCPICRINITEENQQRLYFAERLLEEKVPAPCKFTHLGCQVEDIGHRLMQHENGQCPHEPLKCDYVHRGCKEEIARGKKTQHSHSCQFRLVDCPIPDCKLQIVQKKLVRHLQEQHGTNHLSNRTLILLFLISIVLNIIFMIVYTFM